MRRFLLDTNVFVYALGAEHHYREPCRAILRACRDGPLEPETSVELVQELASVLLRRAPDRLVALGHVRDAATLCRLHDFAVADIPLMMSLLEGRPGLAPRDAQFAATALGRGVRTIVSADRDFDGIAGIERIDPADADAVATLG